MRGKVQIFLSASFDMGITPAYAGKSSGNSGIKVFYGDHPRLCGEKADFILSAGNCSGSPPPMRGKVTVQCDAVDHGGITPAYAGKRHLCPV